MIINTNQKEQLTINSFIIDGAGPHNSLYRGIYLGDHVSEEQWAEISAGRFRDLYIGDYWTINGINWRIAAFDYYLNTGDVECTTHHIVIVPDTVLYNYVMNDTNITTGAYIGSKMYTSGLNEAKNIINNAFGSGHILNHRQFLQNATNNGISSGGVWSNSTVELMTEQNVYGCRSSDGSLPDSCLHMLKRQDTQARVTFFLFAPEGLA